MRGKGEGVCVCVQEEEEWGGGVMLMCVVSPLLYIKIIKGDEMF